MLHLSLPRPAAAAVATAALVASLLGGVLGAPSAVAARAVTGPAAHNPIGGKPAWHSATGGVRATGWAADPDDLGGNLTVYAELDGGHVAATTVTSVADPAVARSYGTGPTPGFSLTVPVPAGAHTLCIVARNTGRGFSTVLGCVPTPFGATLSARQVAAHSPRGAVRTTTATTSSVDVTGWATDPDYVDLTLLAVLYIDGSPAETVATTRTPAPTPTGAGGNAAFHLSVPVSTGTHVGCVWIVNVGLGSNTFLGCNAVDTRGTANGPAPVEPAINRTVLAQALTHRGQSYVWGATGPKTFDCSGLVLYSYRRAGMTLPRVSEAQALSAHLIRPSRVVPGDLVFTHDSEGDFYHVGIYVKPGLAFAAIDTQEGVNYQNIWDPSSTTYGSFTHT